MGNMLTWKAKGKRPNLTGHDHFPSLSMMRMKWTQGMSHSRMKLGEVRSPTKGKGNSANPKGDNNTVGMQMDDPDPDKGS